MRSSINALLSAAALAGLAWATAVQATSLSELPLKMSALAKPNVIFAMDDSGSQDWEAVLGTDNGVVHWRGDGSGGPSLTPVVFYSRRIGLSGGGQSVPIEAGGSILGGIGVSGAPSAEADDKCAKAGINAIKDALEF